MNYLRRRVDAVERGLRARTASMFIVHYHDGTTTRIHPGDAVRLCLEEPDKIARFEDMGTENNGILEGLCNALLIDEEGVKHDAEKIMR